MFQKNRVCTVGNTTYSSGNIGNITETTENGTDRSTDTNGSVSDPVTGETVTLSADTTTAGTVYRMYDPTRGEHFYTKSSAEANYLTTLGWIHEQDSDFSAVGKDDADAIPVFRVYNPHDGGMHFYTTSADEVKALITSGWSYEGISHYELNTDSASGTPQYRLYNPNSTNGEHNWTASVAEKDQLVAVGWINEGISWRIR